MPDCYCCSVSRHYSSAQGRGQGEIHDALFFMTGGISQKDDQLMVNVAANSKVSIPPGRGREAGGSSRRVGPNVIVRSHPAPKSSALP
jgi:hypothetical protein